jgi:hypothetical protein
VVEKIKALEAERAASDFWLQMYAQRPNHEEWEDAAYREHSARQEKIVKQLAMLRFHLLLQWPSSSTPNTTDQTM